MDPKALYSDRIERAVRQAAEHITDDKREPPLWPMSIVETLWYLAKYFCREMYLTIEKLRANGLSEEKIAKLFKTPTRLTYIVHHTEFPIEGLTPEQCESLFHTIMDYVAMYRKADIYCENAKNILWESDKIEEALAKYTFIDKVSVKNWDEYPSVLGRLNATLWMYSEFIHAAKHPYSHEFHGPYPLTKDRQMIVRHYYDLKLVEIWPFLKDVPYSEITTLEIYRSDLDIGFSFFNHSHTRSSYPLPQALKSFSLMVGDDEIPLTSVGEIRSLQKVYQEMVSIGNEKVREFTKKDWHKKILELHYYYLKPLKDILGEKWQPPKYLYDFIDNTDPDEKFVRFLKLVEQAYAGAAEPIIKQLTKLFLENIYSASDSKYQLY